MQILEGMPMTDEVEELLRVLGPFYELIDEKKKVTQISDLSTGKVCGPLCRLYLLLPGDRNGTTKLNSLCLLSAQPV